MSVLDEPLTEEEADHLLKLKEQVIKATSARQILTLRRDIRRRIHKIRIGRKEFDKGLSKLLIAQFSAGMAIENFTFEWDISASDPLMVVSNFQWVEQGGAFETINEVGKDGVTRPKQICYPTAFTRQEL